MRIAGKNMATEQLDDKEVELTLDIIPYVHHEDDQIIHFLAMRAEKESVLNKLIDNVNGIIEKNDGAPPLRGEIVKQIRELQESDPKLDIWSDSAEDFQAALEAVLAFSEETIEETIEYLRAEVGVTIPDQYIVKPIPPEPIEP